MSRPWFAFWLAVAFVSYVATYAGTYWAFNKAFPPAQWSHSHHD